MNFTTRSSEGSDDLLRNIPNNSLISIHAPVKGATEGKTVVTYVYRISIHAPAKGATAQSCTVYG